MPIPTKLVLLYLRKAQEYAPSRLEKEKKKKRRDQKASYDGSQVFSSQVHFIFLKCFWGPQGDCVYMTDIYRYQSYSKLKHMA